MGSEMCIRDRNTVIPENSTHKGAEHMYSFDYAYLLEPARDWLMQQKREK